MVEKQCWHTVLRIELATSSEQSKHLLHIIEDEVEAFRLLLAGCIIVCNL